MWQLWCPHDEPVGHPLVGYGAFVALTLVPCGDPKSAAGRTGSQQETPPVAGVDGTLEAGARPFDRKAVPARAPYTEWWIDFFWHRVMFKQSANQWLPEDVLGMVLRLTRSRTEFTTTQHLRVLIEAQRQASEYERLVRRAMAGELHTIKLYFPHPDSLNRIYHEFAFHKYEGAALLHPHNGRPIDPRSVPWIAKTLRGWPCQNPITRLWEMRQLQNLCNAVLWQISDARHDLVVELTGRVDPSVIEAIDWMSRGSGLKTYREERGDPGDPRRAIPVQTYTPLPREPTPETQLQPMPHHIVVKALASTTGNSILGYRPNASARTPVNPG